MQLRFKRIPLFFLGLLVCMPTLARDLNGTWLVVPPSHDGIARWQVYAFSTSGKQTVGTMHFIPHADNGLALKRITVHQDTVNFQAPGGMKWQGAFVSDNELHLTWSVKGYEDQAEQLQLRKLSTQESLALQDLALENHPRLGRLDGPPLRDLSANGLAKTPVMGWNSWNHYSSTVDDKAIREAADALVSTGLRDVGYVYVNIDDGWQGQRDKDGVLHPNAKFPDMKSLADYVHSRGLKFGIYSSPGPFSCANYLGSHGYEAQDAKTFASWGVDLLKYDWCSAGAIYTDRNDMRVRYQLMGDALQGTGRPIVYSLCEYGLFDVGSWGRTVGGNLWRISGDSDVGRRWSAVSARFETNGSPQYSGPGGWNDPDMLLIGNGGLSAEEYRTHLTLWVMLAAPLILGNRLPDMTTDIRDMLLNRDVIAIDQDAVGVQGQRAKKRGMLEVWSKPLANQDLAVALFNRGKDSAEITIKLADLGFPKGGRVRNLWERKDLDGIITEYSAMVPPHGSVLLRLTKM